MNRIAPPTPRTHTVDVPKREPGARVTGGPSVWLLVVIIIAIAAVGLVLDLGLSPGVSSGVPYVALVLLGLWLPRRGQIFLLAALGSVLTIVGYFGSPSGSLPWVEFTDHGLALLAIWITALLLASRKHFEIELEKREKTLSKIMDATPDAVVITRRNDGLIRYVNRAFTSLFKYTAEEALGKTVLELKLWIDPDDRNPLVREIERKGEVTGFDVEYRIKGGQTVPMSVSYSVLEIDGEECAVSIARDSTERKQAADLLQRSEALLAETERMAKVGGWEMDAKTKTLTWTRQLYRMVELPHDHKLGLDDGLSFIDPIDRPKVAEAMQRMIDTGEPYDLEARAITAKGKHLWTRVIGKASRVSANTVTLFGTVQDITERKQAEEELRRYEHIASSSTDMLALLDRDFVYLAVNRAHLAAFGKTPDELIGRRQRDVVGNRFFDDVVKPNAQRSLAGEEVNYQDWYNFPALGRRYMDVNYYPYRGADDAVKGFVVNGRDITERKRAEDALRKSEAFLAETGRMAQVGGWELDAKTLEVTWTDETYRIHEVALGEQPPLQEALDFFHPDDRPRLETAIQKALELGEPWDMKLRFITAKGRHLWSHTICKPTVVDGKTVKLTGTFQNITERKQAEEELQKLSRAVESSSSAVMITDSDGNIEYVNSKFTEITGYTREEAMGQNPRMLSSGEAPDALYADLWATIIAGGEWKGEFHNRKKDGTYYWGRASISGVRDREGTITHFIGIQDDVTHEYELSEQLSHQASHDALTGLVNRHEFEHRAERLLSTNRRDGDQHALCFMDLDQFKVVNDTCGHTAGDELLRQLSTVLQHAVRKRDTLARLGGDEFGVLMEHCSLEHARRVATALQKAIQDYQFAWEGHTFKVGVSIGLVAITETIPNLTELLKQADAACYMAKDLGRNRIHVYHTEDSEIAQRHGEMQWVQRINQALEEHRFCLHAQTIVPLDGSIDKHYELLIRMEGEKQKLIPPGAFLPAAERYYLIAQLDCWVIEKAFSLLAAHPAFINQIQFISINLSGQSLARPDVLDFIISQLNTSRIEAKKVCFEITETAAIANLTTAIKFISTLKELGCRFALDDFGSGLSSFGYLRNLPVDYLKIDGMFVKDIVDDPIARAMVKSINEVGQVMGMQTIAEFVENDEIKGMLREMGVNYAQGYGIAKPLALDELLGRSNNVTEIK